jgi:methyltransferase (TIGR00027 family)
MTRDTAPLEQLRPIGQKETVMTIEQQEKWGVADSAHWAAFFRANETRRADALFRDPFAERLAGDAGAQLGRKLGNNPWAWVARTLLIDKTISRLVSQGVDAVVNLACGLDARPYRMDVPRSLRWYEADLPKITSVKNRVLAQDTPVCNLERIEIDLAQVAARRELFARLGTETKKALVVTEGLLIYLTTEQVIEFTRDLAATKSFRYWLLDIVSPQTLRLMQNKFGRDIHRGAPMVFGPPEGAEFFEPYGWRIVEVNSLLKYAAGLGRLPLPLRLAAMVPQRNQNRGSFMWNGVVLLERKD